METIKYPVKNLSLYVSNVDDSVIHHISALGSELLSLELSYSQGFIRKFSNERFPKLQRLTLRRNLSEIGWDGYEDSILLDFEHKTEVLKELKIENELIDLSVINSLKCLINLECLSLSKCCFSSREAGKGIIQELGLLTCLRSLNLSHMNLMFDEPVLYNMLKELINLEHLNISFSKIDGKDMELLINFPFKKWKKLGIYGVSMVPEVLVKALADQMYANYSHQDIKFLLDQIQFESTTSIYHGLFEELDVIKQSTNIHSSEISRIQKMLEFPMYGVPNEYEVKVKALADQVFAWFSQSTFESLLDNGEYYSKDHFSLVPFWAINLMKRYHFCKPGQKYKFRKIILDAFEEYMQHRLFRKLAFMVYTAREAFQKKGYRPCMEKHHRSLGVERFCEPVDHLMLYLLIQNLLHFS